MLGKWEKLVDKVNGYLDYMVEEVPIQITIFILVLFGLSICLIMSGINKTSSKSNCLNSPLSRRWHDFVCEEYQDDGWVEVDPDTAIYYYNSAAGKHR